MQAAKKLLLRLLAALGLLWLILLFTPLVSWWAQWLSAGYSDEPRPVVVVLAAETGAEDLLGYSTYLRCVYAFWYWQRHDTPQIVLSGGPEQQPTARLMAGLMTYLGVPPDRLLKETQSTTTRENLRQVARMLGPDPPPVTLITSDYHMRRALLEARRAGLPDVAPHPVPDVLKRAAAGYWERPGLALLLAWETAKLAAAETSGAPD